MHTDHMNKKKVRMNQESEARKNDCIPSYNVHFDSGALINCYVETILAFKRLKKSTYHWAF